MNYVFVDDNELAINIKEISHFYLTGRFHQFIYLLLFWVKVDVTLKVYFKGQEKPLYMNDGYTEEELVDIFDKIKEAVCCVDD